jgi:hypothetical protein
MAEPGFFCVDVPILSALAIPQIPEHEGNDLPPRKCIWHRGATVVLCAFNPLGRWDDRWAAVGHVLSGSCRTDTTHNEFYR